MQFARSLAFKLTVTYVLLFGASVALLFAVVGTLTSRSMEREIRSVVEREARSLADEYLATGQAMAASLVERRLRSGNSAYYLMQGPDGTPIAGNVAAIQPAIGSFSTTITINASGAGSSHDTGTEKKVLGHGILLRDGTYVFAAEGMDWLDSVHAAIRNAFVIAGFASMLLGIAGGMVMSKGILQRIEAVNHTAANIVAGRIDARIPVSDEGDEIDAVAANLNAMLDRIEHLMVNLKQVSSDIAHDLRTPLSRLRQRLEAARTNATSAQQLRIEIGEAIGESDSLLETFTALLRIAQIESGSRRVNFAPVELSQLVDLVASTFAAVAEDQNHRLVQHTEIGVVVIGDRELLLQMATNLVENAIRHTPAGSLIEVRLRKEVGSVVLEVADNGPGIPEAERGKVLRRFYRLEASRTTQGSGLGLALVAAVAELHGAKLNLADNHPGLIVTVRFPLQPTDGI
jgi:signal transduction histidine kinase